MSDDSLKSIAEHRIRSEHAKQAIRAGMHPEVPGVNVCLGLVHTPVAEWVENGDDFIYVDHSYFERGWHKNYFRAIRNGFHLNRILRRPDDRLKRFGVEIRPWRRYGRRIVIIPPSYWYGRIYADLHPWALNAERELRKYTDRPIEIKVHKDPPLRSVLENVWAVVTSLTAASVEAALDGVPVFAGPLCAAAPISAGALSEIERPHYAENRHEWACSLTYACWHRHEIDKVRWLDYDYSQRDDMS